MANNPKSDIPPQEQEEIQKLDNLTIIPGVNEALEQWLRESLKVYTFADLAKLSAQKIRARGKQTGEVLSIEELEPILAKARELAEASSTQSNLPGKTKPEKAPAPPKPPQDWNDFANFVICFERKTIGGKEQKRTKIEHRTGIQHMETSEQASWPGVVTEEACRWMLERLGEETSPVTEPNVEKGLPETTNPPVVISGATTVPTTTLEVVSIDIFQPPASDQPINLYLHGQASNGFVKGSEPLSIAFTLRLRGENPSSITKQNLQYEVALSSHNLLTTEISQLARSTPEFLKDDQLAYTTLITPLTLPSGVFSLKAIATIRNDHSPLWAYANIPLLQVS